MPFTGGYGNFFGYDVSGARGDGFEVKTFGPKVIRFAIPNLVFALGMNESTDAFGVGKGGTFTVPMMKNWTMPTSVTPLTSGTAITVGTQQTDKVEFSMYEYGTGIGYETLTDWITNIPFQTQIQTTLGIHIARMINWLHYDTLSKTIFSIEIPAPGSYSALLGTSRKLQGTAYGELGPGAVALAYDSMKASLVPANDRGMYLWMANASTLRGLKAGSYFQNQVLYKNVKSDSYQILGEFEKFIFVETEEQFGRGTSLIIGQNAGGYGFGLTPKTFYYPDYGEDAGRISVWKTKFYHGGGAIMRDKGTACVIVRSKSAGFDYSAMG